jgi:hypothetical protein
MGSLVGAKRSVWEFGVLCVGVVPSYTHGEIKRTSVGVLTLVSVWSRVDLANLMGRWKGAKINGKGVC